MYLHRAWKIRRQKPPADWLPFYYPSVPSVFPLSYVSFCGILCFQYNTDPGNCHAIFWVIPNHVFLLGKESSFLWLLFRQRGLAHRLSVTTARSTNHRTVGFQILFPQERRSPISHGVENGQQTLASDCQRVFYPGRNNWKYFAMNEPSSSSSRSCWVNILGVARRMSR